MRTVFVVWTAMLGLAAAVTLTATQTPAQTGFVLGRVVDSESGRGIAGVLVSAIPRNIPTTPPAGPPPRGLTDSEGRYILRDLPLGSYGLNAAMGGYGFSPSGFLVTGSGHQIGAYLNGEYGQSRPDSPGRSVEVTTGSPNVADAVIRLWKGAALEGTITDEAGDALVGMYVAAVQRDSSGHMLTGPSTRSDDRGWFRIGTLRPGDYVLVVPHTQFFVPSSLASELRGAPANAATRQVLGRSGGAPPSLDGVVVGQSIATSTEASATTNRLLPKASANQRALVYRTTFYPSAASSSRATTITLKAGETRRGLSIQLEPVAATRIAGVLSDEAGPVPNFGVRLMPADVRDGSETIEIATTSTDGRGNFEFPAVPPGSYELRAERQAGTTPSASGRSADSAGSYASEHVAVDASPATNVQLVLRSGHRLSGRLEFAGKGAPPTQRTTVLLTPTPPRTRSQDAAFRAPIDANGGIDFGRVPPGRYLLNAASPPAWPLVSVFVDGRDITDRPFELGRDAADLLITLNDTPASIGGTVRMPTGDRADDIAVFVMPADRSRWADGRYSTRTFRTVRLNTSGAFTLTPVVPGEYLVVATADRFGSEWIAEATLTKLAAAGSRVTVRAGTPSTLALNVMEIR